MKRVLVPVLTAEDAAALPLLADHLASVKPEVVVVINNPSVGVTNQDLTATIDKQILEVERSKQEATAREDFDAAKNWKGRLEELKMDRQTLLREGWKKVSDEVRFAAYDKFLEVLKAKLGPLGTTIQNIPLSEDSTYETLFLTLSTLQKVWGNLLPEGRFSLVYPQSAPKLASSKPPEAVSPNPKVEAAPKPSKPAVVAPLDPREARSKELSRYMKLKAVAKEKGISMEGRPWTEVRDEILAQEFPVAA